jgi:hypothetical protein
MLLLLQGGLLTVCDDTPLLCQCNYRRTHFAYLASVPQRSLPIRLLFIAARLANIAATVTCLVT